MVDLTLVPVGGPNLEELTRVVPFVEGLSGVDALVALETDQLATSPRGDGFRELGFANARIALE